jgi:hypothetical protein
MFMTNNKTANGHGHYRTAKHDTHSNRHNPEGPACFRWGMAFKHSRYGLFLLNVFAPETVA